MEEGHQLRHLGHLHRIGAVGAIGATHHQAKQHQANAHALAVRSVHNQRCRGTGRNGHANHAEQVATDGSGGVRQAFERLDKADRREQVEQGDEVHAHFAAPWSAASVFLTFFLNISSIRRVTRKPPKILTEASATANTPMV